MRNTLFVASKATLVAFAASLLLSGCQKDGNIALSKGAVKFGAKASAEVLTRTSYSNEYVDSEGKRYQRINWIEGDKIRVYSPEAMRRVGYESGASDLYQWADYGIRDITSDGRYSNALLTPLNNDGGYDPDDMGTDADGKTPAPGNGLFWDGKEKASFVSIYPAPSEDEGTGRVDGTSGTFKGNIPSVQSFSVAGDLSTYGYMTAVAMNVENGKDVSLDFYPAFTALEFSIRSAADAIGLSSFELTSSGPDLTGDFKVSYDMTKTAPTPDYSCSGSGKKISVSLEGQSAPAASEEKDLTFTVLALPQDLSGLTVSFTTATGEVRSLALNTSAGTPVSFAGLKKHRIYGLILPSGELLLSVDIAPWKSGAYTEYTTIESITSSFVSYRRYDDDADFSSWDIPGTYIAIAYGVSDETVDIGTEESPNVVNTNRPLYSTLLTLETVSVGVALKLHSDNPNIGFVTADANGVYSEAPVQDLTIRASEDLEDVVTTSYFVVPTGESAVGQTANITLLRTDFNVPVAYSHQDLPGSYDHTKVPFKVLSADDYSSSKTKEEIPSI